MPHCAMWLHKLLARLHLKTPKHCTFSFSEIRVTFQYYFLLLLCSIALFQRVVINFTPFLISFNLYLLKKNKKLLILHPGHPSLCTLLISKILHHPANRGSYEICTLKYFFQKKKKKKTNSFLLLCIYTLWGEFLHTSIFEKPPKLKILQTHGHMHKTMLFNLSLSLQSLSPTTHKI